ncbi:MAG: response regulator, partial [Bacteroidetes bacterium]|nr:response regulator [Bacteroidota bacterium]
MSKRLYAYAILSILWSLNVGGQLEPGVLPFLGESESLSVEHGLSNMNITAICQDSMGYLWIGTARGLNRYDGLQFKHFFFSPGGQSGGIPYDFVEDIFHCRNHIFVKTRLGTSTLDLKNGKWHDITADIRVSDMTASGSRAYFIIQGNLFEFDFKTRALIQNTIFNNRELSYFVQSDDDCLRVLTQDRHSMLSYCPGSEDYSSSSLFGVETEDGPFFHLVNQTLFLSTKAGLYILPMDEKGAIRWEDRKILSDFIASSPLSVFVDVQPLDNSHMLITFFEHGLHLYDLENGQVTKLDQEIRGIQSELIKCLFKDQDDNLWIGTFDNGLAAFHRNRLAFNIRRDLNLLSRDIFINTITSNPRAGDLLMGTRTQGLVSTRGDYYQSLNRDLESMNMMNVINLFIDSEEKIWIAGYDKLVIYDQNKETIILPDVHADLSHIQHISEMEGSIYLASHQGFYIYSLDGKLKAHPLEKVDGGNQVIHMQDSSLYCSELSGLYSIQRESLEIEPLTLRKDGAPFHYQGAVCMMQESDSILWIGTLSWGLIRVNLLSLESTNYLAPDGLPGNDITAIEKDHEGRLWLSTSDGISCMFSPGQFINFSSHEGIWNYQFHRRSSFRDDNGTIYFGGNRGLSYFKPDEIKLNEAFEEPIFFHELIVNEKAIEAGDESGILIQSLPFTEKLIFDHRVTNFSIAYSATEFYAHDQVLYTQKLEGLDTRWQLPSKSQRVNYSNLPPGLYTLHVKARRDSGIWSEPSSIGIRVLTSPWYSWWAFSLYLFSFVLLVFLIFSLRFRNRMMSANLEAEQHERLRDQDITEMKLRFFTNISHEFRTPLSIINGIISLISRQVEFEGKTEELFQTLRLNVDRLIRLINQLLTFRELESDTLKLSVRPEKINELVDKICSTFEEYVRGKDISLMSHIPALKGEFYCDADKVDKILSNLISNAIKYTSSGGSIRVSGRLLSPEDAGDTYSLHELGEDKRSKDGYLEISVIDNGRGIKPDKLGDVFNRYTRDAEDSGQADYSSSGIGLHFGQRLVRVHLGDIRVKSIYREGAEFSFILPLEHGVYDEDQIKPRVLNLQEPNEIRKEYLFPEKKADPDKPPSNEQRIVIVEDDVELCNLLTYTFSDLYRVSSAHDGDSGLELIRKQQPDLVISDIMMPGMSGLALCQAIKGDEDLNHVLVILLSARSEVSYQIEGLELGADLYIPKPFNLDYLLAVVHNQFRIREQIHSSYLRGLAPILPDAEAGGEVVNFLARFNRILEEEVSNVDLSVDELAKRMNMGRS